MLIPLPCRHPALFLTGVLSSLSAAACSKDADRRDTVVTASSTAGAGTITDSTPRSADTSKATPPDTPPKSQPAPVKPKAPPKPSIDPGRKPATRVEPGSGTKPSSDPLAAPAKADDKWLKYDAATNTVTFELIAGPFNFNGYTSGGATLTVPAKANVVMNFVNKDGTPHSAIVISGEGPIPNAATDPAIPRAYTNKALEGLPQEGSDVMRFTVPESGQYRIFCGVPGHGLSGMWIWLKVDPAAKAPTFGPTKV